VTLFTPQFQFFFCVIWLLKPPRPAFVERMVLITCAVVNLNHITRGVDAHDWAGVWLAAIGIAIAVALWLLATPFTLRFPRVLQKTGWISHSMRD
jgi:hypothetical protein